MIDKTEVVQDEIAMSAKRGMNASKALTSIITFSAGLSLVGLFIAVVLSLSFKQSAVVAHETDPHPDWSLSYLYNRVIGGETWINGRHKEALGEPFYLYAILEKDLLAGPDSPPIAFEGSLPDGLEFVSVGEGCRILDGGVTVRCSEHRLYQRNSVWFELRVVGTAPGEYEMEGTLELPAGEGSYTPHDSKTFQVEIAPRTQVDLELTQIPDSGRHEIGEDVPLEFAITNNGLEEAHDVLLHVTYPGYNAPRSPLSNLYSDSSCITRPDLLGGGALYNCLFWTIAPGETVTSTVIVNVDPYHYENDGLIKGDRLVELEVNALTFDFDNDSSNNVDETSLEFVCNSYVHKTATVDPSAKIADGCSYIGAGAVIEANAKIGRGADVFGDTRVGQNAEMAHGTEVSDYSETVNGVWTTLPSELGPFSKMVTGSSIVGILGERAELGRNVYLGNHNNDKHRVIVGARAKVGSGSRLGRLAPFSTKEVRIFDGAEIPSNTTIDEAYCLENPDICVITDL